MGTPFQSSNREQRLDFWRGLCLVDMLLVHLYYQQVQFGDFLGRLLGDYTRFAAGGFIFVSGLSIGVIFWPRANDDAKRSKTYKGLWRRSVYILGVHFLCALVLVGMQIVNRDLGNFNNPALLVRDIFLMRGGGDLLPFYVLMIAISPFIMQALRKKWGWLFVLVSSLSVYIWGLWHPWAFAPAQHDKFPPVLWQAIFVLGLLSGYAWPKYNALSNGKKLAISAAAWLGVGVLFVMEYGYEFGMRQFSFGTAFTKIPLSTPEALRYMTLIVGLITITDVLWPYIGDSSFSHFVQTLGRKSLPVYALHLWVVYAMGALATNQLAAMGAWQILLAVVSLLALWVFALILDVSGDTKKKRPVAVPARPSIFGPESFPGAAGQRV